MERGRRSMVERARVADIFRETFTLDGAIDVEALAYRQIPAWDSVGHMQLVAALESAFDVMLETDEIIDMSSFDKAVEILSRHLVDA
ncbi:acyl carrier protein [Novispirillum sp. DQ9]|uniref:acyl carrier protein n=1 Tax=Novispirillum sp. DQ9 TaxID=3398612 RepID=UPI003C7CCB43